MNDTRPLALIIEDNKDEVLIFTKALQVAGFEVEGLRTGEEALERLQEIVPDIVLLDLHLPRITGADILRQIKGAERLATTQVLVLTGDLQIADRLRGEADLMLIKPIGFTELIRVASGFVPPAGADDE